MNEQVLATMDRREVFIAAKDPQEMEVAQRSLIKWMSHRMEECSRELSDLEHNYEVAKKAKWRISPWKARMAHERKRLGYYEKCKAALEAGYHLVPNFPVTVFAIRTTKDAPAPKREVNSSWHRATADQQSNCPAIGAGDYVSPQAAEETTTEHKEENGKTQKICITEAVEFLPVDFPFGFAKAEILEDTKAAMALKVFDRIAGVPPKRRKGDPIIVGQIVIPGSYRTEKVATFLVSWFMDLRQL